MIYTIADPASATHTIEVLWGEAFGAEGEDFTAFFAGDTQAADAILTWLEEHGVTDDDPDMYALVVPVGEGQDNPAIAVLPIAPAEPADPALVAEQTTAKGGRPALVPGESSVQLSFRVPQSVRDRLDKLAGRNRSALLQQWTTQGLATLEAQTSPAQASVGAVGETLENWTPHPITLVGTDGTSVTLPPAGPVPRVTMTQDAPAGSATTGGITVPVVVTASTAQVTGLPAARQGVLLVVSRVVAQATPWRDDLVIPHDTVRDTAGRIVGCRTLARISPAGDHQKYRVDEPMRLIDGDVNGLGLVPAARPPAQWIADWAHPGLEPAPQLEDQTDNPHTVGTLVHRRDADGWYIRLGPCHSNLFAEPRCFGVGFEQLEDHLSGERVSYPVCGPCWAATSDER